MIHFQVKKFTKLSDLANFAKNFVPDLEKSLSPKDEDTLEDIPKEKAQSMDPFTCLLNEMKSIKLVNFGFVVLNYG